MGLDIHKFKIVDDVIPSEDSREYISLLKSYADNGDVIALRNLLNTVGHKTRMAEVLDIKGFFEARNESYQDYILMTEYYGLNEDGSDSWFIFVHKETNQEIKVPYNDLPECSEEELYINVLETGYQRRGLKEGFDEAYKKKYPELTGYATVYIINQNGLDIIKEYAVDDTPIKEWVLQEDEIVMIDW